MDGEQKPLGELELCRVECVMGIANGVLKVIKECLQLHGANDPTSALLASAGLHYAIDLMDKNVDPSFRGRMLKCLQEAATP